MTRQIAFFGTVLCLVALVGCDGHPPVPTALGPSQATAPPGAPTPPGASGPSPYSDPLAGEYSLTLSIGSGCAAVPEAEKTRTYSATIDYADRGLYVVTLSGGTFLTGSVCTAGSGRFAGIGCHQFFASEDIDTVQFFLENNNDEAHGGHIVEQLASGAWLEITGYAGGKLDLSSMEAAGTGTVWSCRTPSSYPFPCPGFVSCGATDMRLALTRRR
jgi:hypothetical protein